MADDKEKQLATFEKEMAEHLLALKQYQLKQHCTMYIVI